MRERVNLNSRCFPQQKNVLDHFAQSIAKAYITAVVIVPYYTPPLLPPFYEDCRKGRDTASHVSPLYVRTIYIDYGTIFITLSGHV